MATIELSTKATTHNRPDPFKGDGDDFITWQNQMLFYFTTLGLQWHLKEEEQITAPGKESDVDMWKHSDFLCGNYILNCLDNVLYKVYQPLKTEKALWNALATKYKTQNISLKKFIVDKFMDYKMVDSKPVTTQLHEL